MSGYQLAENVSLAGRNTFRVPARAAMMADVSRADALAELFEFAMLREGPVLVLGEGSNLLFAGDFPGVAICLTMAGVRIVRDDGDTALVRADAGMNWNDLVAWTLARGLCGLENMALIPGTVGAAPIQNIGAYGTEVGEFIHVVEVFDRHGLGPVLPVLVANDHRNGSADGLRVADAGDDFHRVGFYLHPSAAPESLLSASQFDALIDTMQLTP